MCKDWHFLALTCMGNEVGDLIIDFQLPESIEDLRTAFDDDPKEPSISCTFPPQLEALAVISRRAVGAEDSILKFPGVNESTLVIQSHLSHATFASIATVQAWINCIPAPKS